MKIFKRILAVILAFVTIVCSQTVVASANDVPVKVLFLGNSLIYYNKMDLEIFPKLCEALGKNVQVESVTEGGSSLYRLSNEKLKIGAQVAQKLENNTYDYVVLQPSRHVSPYEYSVYHAEYAAALKLNEKISKTGARTLLLAAPGVNTGEIELCTVNEKDFVIVENEYLPIDRYTHQRFFENLCSDLALKMDNADVVRVGAASELIINKFPDFNSLYRADNRHPSVRGSYLQAACIYATIFGESPVGAGYVDTIYPHNAVALQRAAAIAMLGESERIFDSEKAEVTLSYEMWSNSEINLYWNQPKEALCYEIFRKEKDEKSFVNIGRTISNECGYLDSKVKSGKSYVYKIQPYYAVGDLVVKANETQEVACVTLAKPSKPIITTINKSTVKLNFNEVETAQFYSIYRKADDESNFEYVGSTLFAEFVDENGATGKIYSYYVVAEKEDGMVVSENSAVQKVFVSAVPTFKAFSSNKNVTLSIKAVAGANKYAIYYKKIGDSKYERIVTSNTSYTLKGLLKGVQYEIKVRACKGKNSNSTASLFRTKTIKVK